MPNAMTFGQADFGQGAFSFDAPGKLDEKTSGGDAIFAGLGSSGKFGGENDN